MRVPEIRLKGKWLTETIFNIGNRVVIHYADRKLIIELADVQPPWVVERMAATRPEVKHAIHTSACPSHGRQTG